MALESVDEVVFSSAAGRFRALRDLLPHRWVRRLESYGDLTALVRSAPKGDAALALLPSAVRGFVLHSAKASDTTFTLARHRTQFSWAYPSDYPEMERLYERAKLAQWDASTALAWSTSVDPENPETALLPGDFFDFRAAESLGIRLDARERTRFRKAMVAWMLSQFLHGEQGALYAAAQVVEAVPFFDGKKFGATQVVDEARHVEAFQRYLREKLGQTYPVNDNLFVVIDALLGDRRWDIKFIGMQIIVEGLALSAFGSLYKRTREPLLKELLRKVLDDEARHVQFGLLALRRFVETELEEKERREREDWAFEIALLMRDRFSAYEVYEEWFRPTISRNQWRTLMSGAPGMKEFQRVMFGRLTRNLRDVGLMSRRVELRYEQAGLKRQASAGEELR
jgi:hypothetical protein